MCILWLRDWMVNIQCFGRVRIKRVISPSGPSFWNIIILGKWQHGKLLLKCLVDYHLIELYWLSLIQEWLWKMVVIVKWEVCHNSSNFQTLSNVSRMGTQWPPGTTYNFGNLVTIGYHCLGSQWSPGAQIISTWWSPGTQKCVPGGQMGQHLEPNLWVPVPGGHWVPKLLVPIATGKRELPPTAKIIKKTLTKGRLARQF